MNYITHSLAGASAGLMVMSAIGNSGDVASAFIMTGAVIGSLLPDIDHRQSWMGHKAPVVASIASGLFKHRGFLHTPAFIALVAIMLSAGSAMFLNGSQLQMARWFIAGCIPGMLSHLIMDTLNVQGIPWLWPLSDRKFSILPIRTGSIVETAVCGLLCVILYGQYRIL